MVTMKRSLDKPVTELNQHRDAWPIPLWSFGLHETIQCHLRIKKMQNNDLQVSFFPTLLCTVEKRSEVGGLPCPLRLRARRAAEFPLNVAIPTQLLLCWPWVRPHIHIYTHMYIYVCMYIYITTVYIYNKCLYTYIFNYICLSLPYHIYRHPRACWGEKPNWKIVKLKEFEDFGHCGPPGRQGHDLSAIKSRHMQRRIRQRSLLIFCSLPRKELIWVFGSRICIPA